MYTCIYMYTRGGMINRLIDQSIDIENSFDYQF